MLGSSGSPYTMSCIHLVMKPQMPFEPLSMLLFISHWFLLAFTIVGAIEHVFMLGWLM